MVHQKCAAIMELFYDTGLAGAHALSSSEHKKSECQKKHILHGTTNDKIGSEDIRSAWSETHLWYGTGSPGLSSRGCSTVRIQQVCPYPRSSCSPAQTRKNQDQLRSLRRASFLQQNAKREHSLTLPLTSQREPMGEARGSGTRNLVGGSGNERRACRGVLDARVGCVGRAGVWRGPEKEFRRHLCQKRTFPAEPLGGREG